MLLATLSVKTHAHSKLYFMQYIVVNFALFNYLVSLWLGLFINYCYSLIWVIPRGTAEKHLVGLQRNLIYVRFNETLKTCYFHKKIKCWDKLITDKITGKCSIWFVAELGMFIQSENGLGWKGSLNIIELHLPAMVGLPAIRLDCLNKPNVSEEHF